MSAGARVGATSEAEAAASRCAALLRGGVAPQRVFDLLAAESPGGCVTSIARGVATGTPVAEALALCHDPAWRVLAAAWQLSTASGSPLAPALERIAAALRAVAELRARRSVLLAGSRATVRLVSALPPLALALGWLLGFDAIPVLFTPFGCALVGVGLLLLACGTRWAGAMTARVERADRPTGIELELCWIALGGGAPPETAMVRVVDAVDAVGAEWIDFGCFRAAGLLATTMRSARDIGVPLRPLLVEEAARARAAALTALERAGERLGVRVLVPLGVCVLPSFVVLGVVPVLIAMLGGGSG